MDNERQKGNHRRLSKAYGDIIKETWLDPDSRPGAEEVVKKLTKAKPEPVKIQSPQQQKFYVEKPWHFDPATERKAALAEDDGKSYKLLDATEKDKQKAISFYAHHPVQGYEIGSVKVIYNKTFNIKFNEHIKTLQQKKDNLAFAPKWSSMSNPALRQKTYSQFEQMSLPYTDPDYPDVKLIPAWHGTKKEILDSIFRIGYSNLSTTDIGYFGKGLYSAYEAEYPYRVYSNGALILNWLAIFSPLPVINNGEFKPAKYDGNGNGIKPERRGDMCILIRKPWKLRCITCQ